MIQPPSFYEALKIQTVALLGVNADAVHIYAGLLTFLLIASRYRNQGVRFWMLLPVFAISCAAEIIDGAQQWKLLGHIEWSNGWHDIINTNLSPIVLWLLMRMNFMPKPLNQTPGFNNLP